MCKGLIQSLMGGGQEQKSPATPIQDNTLNNKDKAVVKSAAEGTANVPSISGVRDDTKKRAAVPGLGL